MKGKISYKILSLIQLLTITYALTQKCLLELKVESFGLGNGNAYNVYHNGVLQPDGPPKNTPSTKGITISTYINSKMTQQFSFDTNSLSTEADKMVNFINSQPLETIFAVGCQEDCTQNMNASGWSALESIGLNPTVKSNIGLNAGLAFIGKKGNLPSSTKQMYQNEKDGGKATVIDCIQLSDVQQCNEVLRKLQSNNQPIDTNCDYTIDPVHNIIYNFRVSYVNGFVYDPECLEHQVKFEGANISKGSQTVWNYKFDGSQIKFSIPHADLEKSGCLKIVEEDQFIWQCTLSLVIWYDGYIQYQNIFFMKAYLSRVQTNSVTINIVKNLIVGDCCENKLNIETALNFCKNLDCTSGYLQQPITVQRQESFYIEHSITSKEFSYYYLHTQQIKVGAFVPDVVAVQSHIPGKLSYKVKANIAMNGMVLEVISKISESPMRIRRSLRQLAEQNIGSNYRVKAVSKTIFIENKKDKNKEKIKQREKINKIMVFTLIGLGSVILINLAVIGICRYIKQKQIKQLNKKKQTQDTQELEQIKQI